MKGDEGVIKGRLLEIPVFCSSDGLKAIAHLFEEVMSIPICPLYF